MTKVDFALAAQAAADPEEVEAIDFGFGEHGTVRIRVPETAQIMLLQARLDDSRHAASSLFAFFRRMMDDADYDRFVDLIDQGVITQELLMGGDSQNEAGILDALMEAASARPTQAPGASSPSSSSTGPRSTGRSRGAGSIQSGSLSAVS